MRWLVPFLVLSIALISCGPDKGTHPTIPTPVCRLTPSQLDFGSVQVGATKDLTFTIKNTGGGTLTGSVTGSVTDSVTSTCAAYSIQSGGGSYSLAANEETTVTVRFAPTATGVQSCAVSLGGTACGSMGCSGTGTERPPGCRVTPPQLDFGSVEVGSVKDLTFTIKNIGGGTLTGSVTGSMTDSCAAYSIQSGGGSYSLAANEETTVTVRFAPTATGVQSCAAGLGATDCGSMECSGTGTEPPPVCRVTPSQLDFGSVQVGSTKDLTFTIKNTGGGTLTGSVAGGVADGAAGRVADSAADSCAAYTIESGGGSYSLSANQELTVTVRFAPTATGPQSCPVNLGAVACGSIECGGTGTEPPPACRLTPPLLAFGSVQVGSTKDLEFTIKNTGGGTLTGSVIESYAAYSIEFGGGSFSLAAGQERAVTVRFTPTATTTQSCTVSLGATACGSMECSGTGTEPPPACQVTSSQLGFGNVRIGSTKDLTFTIRNVGGGILASSVTESCDAYSLPSGGGTYSLAANEERAVTVRFAPTVTGAQPCWVNLGDTVCGLIGCSGTGTEPPPVCQLTPSQLAFGSVQVGATKDLTFTIKNTGGGTLTGSVTGSVTDTCAAYSIQSGGGSYSLTAGQDTTVTVRFVPTATGAQSCTVSLGSVVCGSMACSGTGTEPPPVCRLTPSLLAFGSVQVGATKDLTFTIKNTGGGTLTGSVTDTCAAYSIQSGGGSYSLTANQEKIVTVRFAPTATGAQSCTLSLGATACGPMACSGTGTEPPPACQLTPSQLAFGSVHVGSTKDLTFTIKNTGGGVLTGSVTENCVTYSIPSGGGSYFLTANQEKTVTVRFTPTATGAQACTVSLGAAACGSLGCSGTGTEPPPVCQLTPSQLAFGSVEVGATNDLTFTIKNTGGGTLTGSVTGSMTDSCAAYAIQSGGGSYSLTANQEKIVTVRFAPTAMGAQSCTLSLGATACGPMACSGTGTEPPSVCQLTPSQLDFGSVQVGSTWDLTFTIKNTGGGTLTGSVSESCGAYSLPSGGGGYALAANEEKTVTVRFAPTAAGVQSCSVSLGGTVCGAVACSGTGTSALPTCQLTPSQLDFGNVQVGSVTDVTFTIKNTGGGTLTGSVSESCDAYSIQSGGGSYSLAANEEKTVTVRFAPMATGVQPCAVSLGAGICGSMGCSGTAEPPPVCQVTPSQLDFGSVQIGSTKDLEFTIRNVGGGILAGSVTESCDAYSLPSGGGNYSLAANQEKIVTVRFAPTVAGAQPCTVSLGGTVCGSMGCSGTGTEPPPVCQLTPSQLAFGGVEIGGFLDLTFTIANTGGGTLTGSVTESCNGYSLQFGGGIYSLTAGQESTVAVRFAPTIPGAQPCTVGLGAAACASVSCTGSGMAPSGMVLVPAGTFTMGSPTNEPGRNTDETQHQVTLTKAIFVSIYEATQAEWQAVMGWNESSFPGTSKPVEQVSWYDAVSYCNRRSTGQGLWPAYTITGATYSGVHITNATVTWNQAANGYRLLTEAEWEYACRATSTTAFCNGGIAMPDGCSPLDPNLDQVGWYCGNASDTTHDVGGKTANAQGLKDMHGNVFEWCWDWYGSYPTGPLTDPTGPASGSNRVGRGGGWYSNARACRSAGRGNGNPDIKASGLGLRLSMTAP